MIMKKADIILIVLGLVISGVVISFLLLQNNANTAVVSIDGKQVDVIDLNINNTYIYNTSDGYNKLIVDNGSIFMLEADCPNKDCINMGKISKNNQTIVCLPHKFSVRVTKGDSEYDYIVE